MAIFHMNGRIVSRSGGRSAVSVAAYNAGDKLRDFETGRTIDKTQKTEIVFSEIDICDNAPKQYLDRETLWNAVQEKESYPNAQMARNIEFSLPKEIENRDEQIEMVRDYVQEQFVSKGMIADWSIHDKGDGNPHCHLMLTMRGIQPSGDWAEYKMRSTYKLDADGNKIPRIDPKTGEQMVRDRTDQGKGIEKLWERVNLPATPWNSPKNMEKWREAWADVCNGRLQKIDADPVDHRSFERQGINKLPTIHEGWAARNIEANGETAGRCHENRKIEVVNHFLDNIGRRIENRSLVEFIIDKVSDVGSRITSIPDMIKAVAKAVWEEVFKFDLIEKIRSLKGGLVNGKYDDGTDARDRFCAGGKQNVEAESAGDFLSAFSRDLRKDAVQEFYLEQSEHLDRTVQEGDADPVSREPDPVDRDEAEYEGRIDRGF